MNREQYDKLIESIFKLIAVRGLSRTTMDLVASRLSMSKRTLYEIFGSKDNMYRCVLSHIDQKNSQEVIKIIRATGNVMEAMANVVLHQQRQIAGINVEFFRDMDRRHRNLRNDYEKQFQAWGAVIMQAIRLGVRQGVIREDTNVDLSLRLLRIQMESLKRMEELFPPEITLAQAFNAIGLGFLRSIATEKGMEVLNKLSDKFNN
ncbi:MAG: TetR/AcrR family transcriptional regulator [Candidatus Amulumruptor caecigallinarius]|nr:TetR/AcrR family transcriptional regulator [Candidatus Amulumruptor caecigallinarius]